MNRVLNLLAVLILPSAMLQAYEFQALNLGPNSKGYLWFIVEKTPTRSLVSQVIPFGAAGQISVNGSTAKNVFMTGYSNFNLNPITTKTVEERMLEHISKGWQSVVLSDQPITDPNVLKVSTYSGSPVTILTPIPRSGSQYVIVPGAIGKPGSSGNLTSMRTEFIKQSDIGAYFTKWANQILGLLREGAATAKPVGSDGQLIRYVMDLKKYLQMYGLPSQGLDPLLARFNETNKNKIPATW